NLRCEYCYENPLRDHNPPQGKPDYDKIKRLVKENGAAFTVFGGEPLVTPIEELEDLWKFGMENWKRNGIQTNGTLITSAHIALFKKYNVCVGFSIDGPHMLNDARSAPSGELNATRRLTELANKNLLKLLKEGISTSLIVTLTNKNATRERLPELIKWLVKLTAYGLRHSRIHIVENDAADHLMLDDDELFEALLDLYELEKMIPLKLDMFNELIERLKTGQGGTCIYQGCDPCNSIAVKGFGPNGESTNCGRVNKEGIDWIKTEDMGSTRSDILCQTPQEDGGCQGCEFWYACKGHCPGTGIGGDWRNRTVYCSVLKRLMRYLLEEQGIKLMEQPPPCEKKDSSHLDEHGDEHKDIPHQDIPHLDRTNFTPHADKTYLPRLEVRNG
ncbi:MAG: radical SAM protein, partial [Candidatus Thorarchaeota archaeon]